MLGSKVSNLLLAEKNLIDFVEKNLGQENDRLSQNELELDTVCHHLVGGSLDYPVAISHDFCDITTAWDLYIESFMKTTSEQIPNKFGHGIYERKAEKNVRMLKMPFRGDELSQKQFLNAIAHSATKIRSHIAECTEECFQTGRLENLYVIISNAVMVRNYIWVLQEIFDVEPKSKLKPEYKEMCDLVEVVSEQMLQCQANLLTTYILQDEVSQGWSSHQAYYEGQRGSPTIPMWAYFLKGMQRDMWRIMPPQLSQRILSILLNDSLGILTARYTQINPTHTTRHQFVCDLVNILATVEELLFYVASDLSLVCGEADPSVSKIIFSIHIKCHCLATSLVLVGCPLDVLYKTFRRGLSSCTLMEKSGQPGTGVIRPTWMKTISSLCPKYSLDQNIPDWKLLNYLKLVCAQPAPNWALVYKVLTMNDRKLATFILTLFPTVIAPSMDFLLEGKSFKRCGNAACMSPSCHSLAKSLANHHVSTCCLYILGHTLPREYFAEAFRPILSTITDWSVMDKTQIWTSTSRPVWFQSLVDLLLPILKTCVQSLCLNYANPTRSSVTTPEQRDDSTHLVIELMNNLTELLSMIPRGFFLVCEEMDDMIPPMFNPVRNNVPIHFLVTALYMLLNLGPKIIASAEEIFQSANSMYAANDQRKNSTAVGTDPQAAAAHSESNNKAAAFPSKHLEQILLSISERLCHLEDTAFDQAIHRLVSQIESMMRQTQTQLAKKKLSSAKTDFFMTNDIASLKADFLLAEVEGQLSLRVAYWFLLTHGDMLQKVIVNGFGRREGSSLPRPKAVPDDETTQKSDFGATVVFKQDLGNPKKASTQPTGNPRQNKLDLSTLKVAPRIRTYLKPLNTVHEFHYVNKHRTFDEIMWNDQDMDWVNTVRSSQMGLQKAMILKQLERRWEFQPSTPDDMNPSVTTAVSRDPSTYKSVHVNKMVEEIRALMAA